MTRRRKPTKNKKTKIVRSPPVSIAVTQETYKRLGMLKLRIMRIRGVAKLTNNDAIDWMLGKFRVAG